MCFNKNTWTRDFSGVRGIKLLGAEDARRQGFTPKYARKGVRAAPSGSTAGEKGPGATRRT